MNNGTRIFLIGFMGVGKTTIGRKLARQMELPFIDLDERILQSKSMSMGDLFSYFGEAYFRKAEADMLREVIETESSFVLSCGGGTPCFSDNMHVMNKAGVSIYLAAGLPFLASRIRQSKTVRPMLKNVSEAEQLQVLQDLFDKRQAYYALASHTINVEKLSVPEVLTLVKSCLA